MTPGADKPEIYIECVVQAGLLKVTAIHSVSGVEASVFGPASSSSREALTRNAVAKLAYILKKNAAKP